MTVESDRERAMRTPLKLLSVVVAAALASTLAGCARATIDTNDVAEYLSESPSLQIESRGDATKELCGDDSPCIQATRLDGLTVWRFPTTDAAHGFAFGLMQAQVDARQSDYIVAEFTGDLLDDEAKGFVMEFIDGLHTPY